MERKREETSGEAQPLRIQNGAAIRSLRLKDGWSVAALAAQVGISQPTLTNIELEHRSVSRQVLNRIARALCVPEAAITRNPPIAMAAEDVITDTEAVA